MNERNLSLKPIRMMYFNTGKATGNSPTPVACRALSQNLIYLCKDTARTAKELSEELCVPMLYVEEELEIQCNGLNGTYGTIRKLDNGKYISTIIVAEHKEHQELAAICEKYSKDIISQFKNNYIKNKDDIMNFPYLSEQKDERFLLWAFIINCGWKLERQINDKAANYFSDIVPIERAYSTVANVHDFDTVPDFNVYGNDGINANSLCGFKSVHMRNCYGKYIDKHFNCGHNISIDEKIHTLLKSIGGISVNTLDDTNKEIVAKTIECNYIRKNGDVVEPKIVAFLKENETDFDRIAEELCKFDDTLIDSIANEIAHYVKNHIPKHLINEYEAYLYLIAVVKIPSILIEGCIKEGLLYEPEDRLGGEGVILIVEK